MTSAMLMERSGLGMQGAGMPQGFSTPVSAGPTWCVLPRCEIKVEKCAGGCKIHCSCEEPSACATLQSLCKMMATGMCSLCCTLNGMTVCQCNLCCGMCKCELTEDGVCLTCTSGDKACCEMIQACCECMACCLRSGCCCYVCLGGAPICCSQC